MSDEEISLGAIPNNFEVGYRDGVWLTAKDLETQSPPIDFDSGERGFLIFTTQSLKTSNLQDDEKELVGIEIVYAENEFLPDVWGVRINRYVSLGVVKGNKDYKRLKRQGEFNHLYDIYDEHNVRFIRFVANFERLAERILKNISFWHSPADMPTSSTFDIVRYYRPMTIPEEVDAWHSMYHWMDRDSFEINVMEILPKNLPETTLNAFVFGCANLMKSAPTELGIFIITYDEYFYSYHLDETDLFPLRDSFRFLGFLGPAYHLKNVYSVETFLEDNWALWSEYENTDIKYHWCGTVSTFSDLRKIIPDVFLYETDTQVQEMNIFK